MKFPYVLENALLTIRDRSSLSFAIRRIGPPCCTLCYYCYLSLVTNYLSIKLLITDNFSACRNYLAENRLSFPSAPCWVRHSYLSKGLRLIPYTCGSSLGRIVFSIKKTKIQRNTWSMVFMTVSARILYILCGMDRVEESILVCVST
jgi:hypothetical protein